MPLIHESNATFVATNAASSDACAHAEGWARNAGLTEVQILRLVLVIEELFTNTIKHGYCEESNRPVHISLGYRDALIMLDYRDQAPPFDPIHAEPTIARDIPPDQVGGMGLQLIQTLGFDARYAYEAGWNIIRLAIGSGQTSPGIEALMDKNAKKKRRRRK